MSDNVTISIDSLLSGLSFAPSNPSIFRVGDHLRSINPEAYDLEIIAIGPFHRGKHHLQNMEKHKDRYLKLVLQRKEESTVEIYVTVLRYLEDRAWKCYAEDIQLDEHEFVKMLLLDGCFIIEFLRKFQNKKCRDKDDPIFQYGHINNHLLHDLMVFENQIPFFIIRRLFDIIKIDKGDKINSLIWPLLQNGIFPLQDLPGVPETQHHLLGIVHDLQCSSFAKRLSHTDFTETENINSAIELQEAGIAFEKSESDSFYDIEFKNKSMIIPVWEISDSTESLFRNMTAYEYYLIRSPQIYVTDYVFFMHCLVHSPEDAKLLRRSGIISNFLGADEMVYRVINQLVKNIIIFYKFSYSNIFHIVNIHCGRTTNIWMATLRRDYFSSPWALISLLAAITLVVLTIIQTTFAILSYYYLDTLACLGKAFELNVRWMEAIQQLDLKSDEAEKSGLSETSVYLIKNTDAGLDAPLLTFEDSKEPPQNEWILTFEDSSENVKRDIVEESEEEVNSLGCCSCFSFNLFERTKFIS
ncbi:Plant protein of unknown function (DUF247) [Abeliophyllum distichum]|uniref:Uncharacterized protein n=1 Tax=Abeliophyllum distichum TaxID=126358 RepID=A0ABD1P2E1_9LAMI